jgi:flagellin-specific chaperone FliS
MYGTYGISLGEQTIALLLEEVAQKMTKADESLTNLAIGGEGKKLSRVHDLSHLYLKAKTTV